MISRKVIGVFINSAVHQPHINTLTAMCHGIRETTDNLVFLSNSEKYMDCDVAVVFGSWKNRLTKHHILKTDIIKQHKKDLIVIETPLLGRLITNDHKYYRVGKNHYMDTLGFFNNKNKDKDRWGIIRTDVGIKVKDWRTKGDHILFLMQLPGDAAIANVDILDWLKKSIIECKKNSDRPIKVRMHPLISSYDLSTFEKFVEAQKNVTMVFGDKEPIDRDLEDCWATVSFTSGGSVDSIINGIPVITPSNLNFVYPISSHSIDEIEKPKMMDRQQLLNDLAYTQWTTTEIAHGLPYKHLFNIDG
tara:strand:+ start:3436 stop:4347 length:912 start_codon:yes stop_codon:yes gene_type:complete